MKCSKCNEELPNESNFCPNCGAPIISETSLDDSKPTESPVFPAETDIDESDQITSNGVSKKKHSLSDFISFFFFLGIIAVILCFAIPKIGGTGSFSKKVSLNEDMDFGDFHLYFTEVVAEEEHYVGDSWDCVQASEDGEVINALEGVITASNDAYVMIDDIKATFITASGKEISVGVYAYEYSMGHLSTEDVYSLTAYDEALILVGGSGPVDHAPVKAIFEYKSQRGKNYKYEVIL